MSTAATLDDAIATVCAQLAAHDAGHKPALDGSELDVVARAFARAAAPLADDAHHELIARSAVAQVTGLGPLEGPLADSTVTEIIVNGGRDLWLERDGVLQHVGQLEHEVVPRLIERILGPLGRRIDRLSPIVDARLADGSRVCAVIPPVAVDGPCLAIRKFGVRCRSLREFAGDDVVALLSNLVDSRCNVVVSGATSSGKTSLLNTLATRTAPTERIVTIEDIAELHLDARHVLRLEARRATVDGVPAVTMSDLLRTALRLRPDRIVVGEVRGVEVVDMLQAFNTGHDGSLVTLHANSTVDAIRRVTALMAQHASGWPPALVDDHVHASIDAIVHVQRVAGGARRVTEILELASPIDGSVDRWLVRDAHVVGQPTRGRA